MFNKKSIEGNAQRRVHSFYVLLVLLFVLITIVGVHVAIGTFFFTKPLISEENKVVLFSLLAASYTLFYYSRDYLKPVGSYKK